MVRISPSSRVSDGEGCDGTVRPRAGGPASIGGRRRSRHEDSNGGWDRRIVWLGLPEAC
jgi:hypothetical protein